MAPACGTVSDAPTMRPAQCSDAPLLSELAFRSKAYWGYSEEFMEACREELSVSAEDIEHPARDYVVCEVGGSVVGYCSIEQISQSQCELEALFVEPQHIGCGYGRLLIEAAKLWASQRGARSLLIQGDPMQNGSMWLRVASRLVTASPKVFQGVFSLSSE